MFQRLAMVGITISSFAFIKRQRANASIILRPLGITADSKAVMRSKTLTVLTLLAVVVACSSAQDASGAPAYQATGFCQVGSFTIRRISIFVDARHFSFLPVQANQVCTYKYAAKQQHFGNQLLTAVFKAVIGVSCSSGELFIAQAFHCTSAWAQYSTRGSSCFRVGPEKSTRIAAGLRLSGIQFGNQPSCSSFWHGTKPLPPRALEPQ